MSTGPLTQVKSTREAYVGTTRSALVEARALATHTGRADVKNADSTVLRPCADTNGAPALVARGNSKLRLYDRRNLDLRQFVAMVAGERREYNFDWGCRPRQTIPARTRLGNTGRSGHRRLTSGGGRQAGLECISMIWDA